MRKLWKFSLTHFNKNFVNATVLLKLLWKFHDFSVTQILREINFGESRSAETAIFAIFAALNSVYLVNSSL